MLTGRLESINTSGGGVPKESVFEAHVTPTGLAGDRQADLGHHGGPDRAIVLFSLDLIRALQAEGHPIGVGTVGENLTVSGLDWSLVRPGCEIRIGPVRLQVTEYASPCGTAGRSFLNGEFTRISQRVHPGWSRVCARVLAGGVVEHGQAIELVPDTSVNAV